MLQKHLKIDSNFMFSFLKVPHSIQQAVQSSFTSCNFQRLIGLQGFFWACYNIGVKHPYIFICVLLVACVPHTQFKSYFSCLSFSPFLWFSLSPLHSMSAILSLRAKPFNLDFNYHVSFVIRLWSSRNQTSLLLSIPLPLQSHPIWWIAHIIAEVIEYADHCWLLVCGS